MIPHVAEANKREINLEDPVKVLVELEADGVKEGLRKWEDAEAIAKLSEKDITEDLIEALYWDFKNVIFDPPDPTITTKYNIENENESLDDMDSLGKLLHNLLLSLSGDDFEKYGRLIGLMRSILYIDSMHTALAIKNNKSRDFYWYELHKKGVKAVDKEYLEIFGD